ncbi:uncharacterized protein LOC107609088 [Arachis ipaensis]|uniref:uncharacterized protein LOC107609088 n=1 Tax=Arachis ipaensis TaxID=130454 RepID=UPI0007AF63CD|nr:uncharacterized protein LOC107609088 [Arachis ipaensis]
MVKLKERGKGGSLRKQKKDFNKVTCYNCKETGHFKSDYPKLKKEEKQKKEKKKGLMASWEDLENDSEDDEESETKSQPCLMADHVEQKKATPRKSGQKSKGFALHNTKEPANLESLDFKNKFSKTHSHYDPARFNSCASYEFHKEVLEKRHLCATYLVNLDSLTSKGINVSPLFKLLQWTPLLYIEKPVYPGLVREFYANLRLIDGTIHSYVKRVHITLDTATIGTALGYKEEGPLSGLDGTTPTYKALGPTNSLLHRIVTHILTPQSGSHNRVTLSDSLIIFALVTSTPISFGYLMIRHMWESVKSTKKANMPYGMFLTSIFEYFKVDLLNEAVENKVSMIKGGGAVKGTKGKKFGASESDYESRPESSKATESIREILTEFSNMSELMIQFHKAGRKLAYENEKAWGRCKDKVSLMLESLDEDPENASEEGAEASDFHLSDD